MAEFDASLFQLVGSLLIFAAFCAILCAIALIDWCTRRIPNVLVGALVVLRLIALGIECALGQAVSAFSLFAGSLASALFFAGVLLVLKIGMERLLHKACLGLGDVKLVAAGLTFLTFDQALLALGVACVAGLALALFFRIVRKDPTFPFGPALCLGLFLALWF